MKKNVIALLIFIILTGIMTYPVVLKMSNHIPGNLGDPLLNTWLLGWDIHKIRTGLSGYWDTNIFYPYKSTLAFSEHLTGIAIFGLPAMLLTNNIIFTYNFLFLLAFVLSGFGAYLLVKHLTGNFLAGIIGGIIFAFAPFRFYHLHMLNAQWIPFGFLYLHKFFEKTKYKYLALFVLFYVLQCISSLHNGLFMTVFAVIFIVYYVLVKKIRDKKFLAVTALSLIFAFIVLLPFSLPYIKVKKQFGFERGLATIKDGSAHIESYLAPSERNRLYHKLTYKLWQHCGLFTSFAALFLAFFGFWPGKTKVTETKTRLRTVLLIFWYTLAIFYLIIMIAFLFTGGKPVYLSGREILKHCGVRPFTNLIILVAVRWFLDKLWRQKIKTRLSAIGSNERFYLYTVILAVLFSFGPEIKFFKEAAFPGPYILLFYLVPGFGGIRLVARFAIMALLGVSVLAGYGYRKLSEKFRFPIKKSILGTALIVLILAEFFSVPVPTPQVKTGKNIPPVYRWLSQQKDDCTVIELPLNLSGLARIHQECLFVYYSTYHRKRIVNGYSGYFPPMYYFLIEHFSDFPSLRFMNSLSILGIKYVIIHSEGYEESTWQKTYEKLDRYRSKVSPIGKFGSAFVYQILNSSFSLTVPEEPDTNLLVPRKEWRAESNASSERSTRYAVDNKLETWWHTEGPRQPGQYFQLDLGKNYKFNRIWLSMGAHFYEYPEDYKLEVSDDSRNWKVVIARGNSPLKSFLSALFYSPSNPKFDIQFNTQKARYIRITQYGKHESYEWAIHEIDVQELPE
jgi:hypothetical protein